MPPPVSTEIELGARLRAVRRAHGLTQADVAQRAGVSRAFVTELERGRRPGAELARVLAVVRALDVALEVVPDEKPDFDTALGALLEGTDP